MVIKGEYFKEEYLFSIINDLFLLNTKLIETKEKDVKKKIEKEITEKEEHLQNAWKAADIVFSDKKKSTILNKIFNHINTREYFKEKNIRTMINSEKIFPNYLVPNNSALPPFYNSWDSGIQNNINKNLYEETKDNKKTHTILTIKELLEQTYPGYFIGNKMQIIEDFVIKWEESIRY